MILRALAPAGLVEHDLERHASGGEMHHHARAEIDDVLHARVVETLRHILGCVIAVVRTGEKVQPSQIAAEISIALVCTAMGLATAIPFNFLLAAINIRMRRLQESLASGLVQVLEYFKNRRG